MQLGIEFVKLQGLKVKGQISGSSQG